MAFKIGERTVTWTVVYRHPCQITVTKTYIPPVYMWSAVVQADGELSCTLPLGGFSIGAVQAASGPIPNPPGDRYPFFSTLTYPGGSQTIYFGLGEGTHTQPTVGTLSVVAACDVMCELDTTSGLYGFHANGFQRDMPDNTHCHVWLRLQEPANWTFTTTSNTYTGTSGTAGQDLSNYLAATAEVKAIANGASADAQINVICSLEDYFADSDTATWSEGGGTGTGYVETGLVRATATPASTLLTATMGCTWRLRRQAYVMATLRNLADEGLSGDLDVLRYGDDPASGTLTVTDGAGSTGVDQKWWSWSFASARVGGGSGGASDNYDGWGDLAVRQSTTLANSEAPSLPEEWGDYSAYLGWKDRRCMGRLWACDGPEITLAAGLDQGVGWTDDYDATNSTTRTSTGQDPPGAWTITGGAFSDDTNNWILTPGADDETMTVERSLLFDVGQLADPPTRGDRPTFAGYRYLKMTLYRRTSPVPEDTVTVRIRQDNLADLFPEPELQTWTRTTWVEKTWTTKVQTADGYSFIEIDLARPDSTGLVMSPGVNPPPESNYGADAHPNVLSRWPTPVMDGPLSGVTLPDRIQITVPCTGANRTWALGSIVLIRKEAPRWWVTGGLNQWIREERHDRYDEDDLAAWKHWRRRYITGLTDGILGLELFDMVRTSHLTTNELGSWHVFDWDLQSVEDICEQVAERRIYQKWERGDPDTFTPVGAGALWPGHEVYVPTYDTGSVEEQLMSGSACWLGGGGLLWTGEAPIVVANLAWPMLPVQALADTLDWFGGAGDLWNMGDTTVVWRCGAVLRGAASGVGQPGSSWSLKDATPTEVQSGTVAASGRYQAALPGGKHQTSHTLTVRSQTCAWNAPTISWQFRPSLESSTIYVLSEAPLWWHRRGLHICHWDRALGPPRWRYRRSDGKPLCSKSTGNCVLCRQGD